MLETEKISNHPLSAGIQLSATIFVSDKIIGESCASVGVDIQTPRSAPCRESIRVDIHFLDGVAFTFEPVIRLLRELQPLLES